MKTSFIQALSMRYLALAIACFAMIASAQSGNPITTSALSKEQAAVYRAALASFTGDEPFDVIDLTGVLRPDEGDYAGCMKDFPSPTPAQVLHRLSTQFAQTLHIHLISPEVAVAHPFPSGMSGGGVRSMTATAPAPPPSKSERMNPRVVLSEIIFDSSRHRAALNVTVTAPGMGHSETHVYKFAHGKWLLEADCGSGIS
jgi:hypothetical protein